jgi:hypothetical protein
MKGRTIGSVIGAVLGIWLLMILLDISNLMPKLNPFISKEARLKSQMNAVVTEFTSELGKGIINTGLDSAKKSTDRYKAIINIIDWDVKTIDEYGGVHTVSMFARILNPNKCNLSIKFSFRDKDEFELEAHERSDPSLFSQKADTTIFRDTRTLSDNIWKSWEKTGLQVSER